MDLLGGGHGLILVEEFREMRHVLRESFLPCGRIRVGEVLADSLVELLLEQHPRVRVQGTRRGRRKHDGGVCREGRMAHGAGRCRESRRTFQRMSARARAYVLQVASR